VYTPDAPNRSIPARLGESSTGQHVVALSQLGVASIRHPFAWSVLGRGLGRIAGLNDRQATWRMPVAEQHLVDPRRSTVAFEAAVGDLNDERCRVTPAHRRLLPLAGEAR
jgi:hypothetical protein